MRRPLIVAGFLAVLAALFVSSGLPLTGQLLVPCGDLPGCGQGGQGDGANPTDWSLPFMLAVAEKVLQYAQLLGELFLALGALYLLLNLGDDERVTKGKNMIIWSLVGIALALFAEEFVTIYLRTEVFVDTGAGNDLLEDIIAAFIRIVQTFFSIALFTAIVFNGFRMVLSRGSDDEYAKAKKGFFWAAIGAIVVNVAGRLAAAMSQLPL